MLIIPYMTWNVVNYIQENPGADKEALVGHPRTYTLIKRCTYGLPTKMYDVASAITYMHAQTPPITHGNLKAVSALYRFILHKFSTSTSPTS